MSANKHKPVHGCIQHVKAVLINIRIKYPDLTFKISENPDMRKWIGFANPNTVQRPNRYSV